MAHPGSGESWEWRTLGVADPNLVQHGSMQIYLR